VVGGKRDASTLALNHPSTNPLCRAIGSTINQALACDSAAQNPYTLSSSLCSDITSFKPLLYFATIVCESLVPTLSQWASAMFALVAACILAPAV
jgi:hypothetical protein